MSTPYSDLVNLSQTLNAIGAENINLDNFNFIPTVKHRALISKLCKKLNKIENIHTFCPTVVLNNDTLFYTSNDPNYSAIYVTSGLCRADNYFTRAYHHSGHYLLTNDLYGDSLQQSVISILQERFQVYNSYCLIRRCEDCTVIVAISHLNLVKNAEKIYEETVSLVEETTIEYFDNLMGLYTDYLPGLKYTRFANDTQYRANVIRSREIYQKSQLLLSAREIECLYWTSKGKTSYEISILMKISEHTVNEHKKHIMKKLKVNNIAHAIRQGLKAGIIS